MGLAEAYDAIDESNERKANMEKQALIVVGHKEGRVYLQHGGSDAVAPNYVWWNPEQARELAALILTAADAAEGKAVSSAG